MDPKTARLLLWLPVSLFTAFAFFHLTGVLAGAAIGHDTPDRTRVVLWIVQLVGLGLPCAAAIRVLRPSPGDLGLPPPAAPVLLLSVLFVAGLWVPLWATDSLRARILTDEDRETLFQDLTTPGIGGVAAVAAVIAVLPALTEELAFRGILQPLLTSAWGPLPGIGMTALLFAAFHGSPAQLVVPFLLGLALGWLRWRTGSLWPGVLGHALHNGVTLWAMLSHPDWLGAQPSFPPLPWIAGGAALAAAAAWTLRRRTR